MPAFTVLLARPDTISESEHDTYLAHVTARDPNAALAVARLEACDADDWDEAEDYHCLLLLAGHHTDENPEN